jgi:uncharacterized protein (DUF433 family)
MGWWRGDHRLGGEPCFEGSRISVLLIGGMVQAGDTIDEVVRCYPSLTREQVEFAVAFVGWLATRRRKR